VTLSIDTREQRDAADRAGKLYYAANNLLARNVGKDQNALQKYLRYNRPTLFLCQGGGGDSAMHNIFIKLLVYLLDNDVTYC